MVDPLVSGRLALPILGAARVGAPRRPRISPGVAVAGMFIAAVGGLALLNGLGWASFLDYESSAGHAEVATFSGVAAILAALLILERFREDGELRYLLASAGLLLLGATSLVLAVPMSRPTTPFLTWFAVVLGVAGRSLFAAAALVPSRTVERRLFASVSVGAGVAAGVLLVGLAAWALRGVLPVPHAVISSATAAEARLSVPAPFSVLQAVSSALLALAALGFYRRAKWKGDELARWLAVAGLLGGLAHANYLLAPSELADWVYVGDGRLSGFFGLAFIGAMWDFAARRARLAAETAAMERARFARDLHDGITQELTFIATQARLAQQDSAPGWLTDIRDAADRALAESRGALRVLTSSGSFVETLVSAAEDVVLRAGARVRIEGDASVEVASREAREALVRIVREAATNAVRHGRASTVTIRVYQEGDALRLSVVDDGIGFDPTFVDGGGSGMGLTGMEARASELGGRIRVESHPGAGSSVELVLP